MKNKTALITGITGQDGAYLAKFLLSKNYQVHGIKRRSSLPNCHRLNYLCKDYMQNGTDLHLHEGDLSDPNSVLRTIQETKPDELYNLAAQSHVQVAFKIPEYTANIAGLGALRLLEALRLSGLEKRIRYYQASTSELFGNTKYVPQNEATPFCPRNPYAVAKLYSYWITVNYREAYGIHASNGILFNHESPFRGSSFVSRKITLAVGRIKWGLQDKLLLGNLNAKRDWGFAGDYVEAMWSMLQKDEPGDYVIATGESYTVREFCELAFEIAGIKLIWQGKGLNEKGIDMDTGDIIVEIDPTYFRPTEVDILLGDSSKAKEKLKWEPKVRFHELVKMMVLHDLKEAEIEKYILKQGYACNSLVQYI